MNLVRDPGPNQCERDTFKSAQAGHFGQESVFFSTFFSDPSTSSVKGDGDGEISLALPQLKEVASSGGCSYITCSYHLEEFPEEQGYDLQSM